MDAPERSEFIRGPKWRTRTTPGRRAAAALFTFALIVLIGALLLVLISGLLSRLGAPEWASWLPWILPTSGVVGWTLARPGPAVLSDDDDDSWTGFVVRFVLVGQTEPRPALVRVAAAILFGAPVVWSFMVLGLASIVGIF